MTSAEESNESRQKYELEALKAIYGDELKDLRGKTAWNRWTPLNLSISLIPQQGNSGVHEINARTDLHVICSELYPDCAPQISLENSKGLSQTALAQLHDELQKRMKELRGEEVIFQLCQHVQEFLHKHNKPSTKSFYDEMLQRQKEKEEKDLQAKLIEEDKQREFIRQEVQKRQEILKSELRLRREHRFSSENSDNYNDNNSNENSDEQLCDHKENRVIDFNCKQIQIGKCFKHCLRHVVFIGTDVKTSEVFNVNEWILEAKTENDTANILKQLSSVEHELNHLTKLRHCNLAHYLAIQYEQRSDGRIFAYILKEFINGLNCTLFLNDNFSVNIRFLKYLSRAVLNALEYLHKNNVVHKDIRDGCVYITQKGNVVLTNYSLHKRLSDLSAQLNPTSWYNKKTDLVKFGEFILSLVVGTKDELKVPNSLPQDFYNFLTQCLQCEDKERFTAATLLKHEFLNEIEDIISPKHVNSELQSEKSSRADTELPSSSQSRIHQEFEFLQYIGKGAFGDVIKVKNNLDGRLYAIKRIKLNPKKEQLNKKIVREVKLLSRLNHENVVRYYNSWIETPVIKSEDRSKSSCTNSKMSTQKVPKIVRHDEFTINDNIEELAPPMTSVEVAITYDSKSQAAYVTSDEESSEEENNWGTYHEDSDSESIEFEKNETLSTISEISTRSSQTETVETTTSAEIVKDIDSTMYIQMEFCEKSTLRNAIDNGIYLDEDRVWKLFREIIEGLAHIHQQGMIHRDLKPVNIFLDSEDHVKIGDFGLATNTKPKLNEIHFNKNLILDKEDGQDESKTGFIGTALYVAPELCSGPKVNYNEKVDIYSLGIIFFEMCYRPLQTGMERISVLQGLRKKEIVLPEDFLDKKKQYLLRWLLNHEVSKRPTSQELLQSEYVPPPVLEECELRELVRHTLSNPQLKAYKYMIASCFNQNFTPAEDFTYDKDISTPNLAKPSHLYDLIREIIVKVFTQHGAQNLPTPLLMPKSKYYEHVDCVKLMTHFGGIVSLPYDLRVPFARYVAWNNICLLRRYSIERVYREKKAFGFLPRELYECAFDIVTPTQGNLFSDAEVLYVIYEIINKVPVLKNKHFTIRLNHALLWKAILIHFSIKDNHKELSRIVANVKDGKAPKNQLQTFLNEHFSLSDSFIATLINIFTSEFEISKATSHLQMITRKKSGDASHLAKLALQDLKNIAHCAEAFGVKFEMVLAPGVVYNVDQYSGMICQFACELKKKHKSGNMEVLAAGGRYDSMITAYRKIMEDANMLSRDVKQSAVGISLSLDKLVQAVVREQSDDLPNFGFVDVAVCSVGSKPLIKEKTKILRDLWEVGVRCSLIESTNIEEIQEQCSELKVPHVIMLKDSEHGTVIVRSWERDRFQEKTIKYSEIVDTMQRIIKTWRDSGQETPVFNSLSRSESKSNSTERNEHSHEANVLVLFATEEKLSSNARKRYDVQIRSHLDNLFTRLNGYVTVLGVSVDANVIKTVASYLEFDSEHHFQKSVESVIERHQRHKKYLIDVCDEIYEQKLKRSKPIVVLFSLSDSFHRLIV